MSAPVNNSESRNQAAHQNIFGLKGGLAMNMRIRAKKLTYWLSNSLKTNAMPKITVALALGALLIVGATIMFEPGFADGLVYSMDRSENYDEQRQVDRQAEAEGLKQAQPQIQNVDSIQDEVSVPAAKDQRLSDSIEERQEVQRVLGAIYADGVVVGPSFSDTIVERMEVRRVTSGMPYQNLVFKAPFHEDFSAVGRIEVGGASPENLGASSDAWMQDAPFYEDFATDGGIEVWGASPENLGAYSDAWMQDAPFYEDF